MEIVQAFKCSTPYCRQVFLTKEKCEEHEKTCEPIQPNRSLQDTVYLSEKPKIAWTIKDIELKEGVIEYTISNGNKAYTAREGDLYD
jgi:hypothetical protein